MGVPMCENGQVLRDAVVAQGEQLGIVIGMVCDAEGIDRATEGTRWLNRFCAILEEVEERTARAGVVS